MLKTKFILSSLLLSLLNTPVLAEDIDKTVIATVDGREIVAQELKMTALQNKIDYNKLSLEHKKLLLNGLINRILVANQARKEKMDQEDAVRLKIHALADSVLAATLLEKKTNEMKFTDAQIKAYYDKKFAQTNEKEYSARHILLKDEAQAKKLSEELKKDKSKFSEVALKKSIDKGSAIKGGMLGWFEPKQMVKPFADAVKSAKIGEVSDPVKSQFGYHIILVDKVRDKKPPKLETVKDAIKQELTKEKIGKYLDDLAAKSQISIKLEDTKK